MTRLKMLCLLLLAFVNSGAAFADPIFPNDVGEQQQPAPPAPAALAPAPSTERDAQGVLSPPSQAYMDSILSYAGSVWNSKKTGELKKWVPLGTLKTEIGVRLADGYQPAFNITETSGNAGFDTYALSVAKSLSYPPPPATWNADNIIGITFAQNVDNGKKGK
jgi:hypothetical protein